MYVDPAHDHAVNVVVHAFEGRYIVSRHDSVLTDRDSREITFRSVIPATRTALTGFLSRLEQELSLLGPYLKGAAGGFALSPMTPRGGATRDQGGVPFGGFPVAGDHVMTLHLFSSPDHRWLVTLAEVPDGEGTALMAFLHDSEAGACVGEELVLHAKGAGLHRAVLLRWYIDFAAMGYRLVARKEVVEALIPGGFEALLEEVHPGITGFKWDLEERRQAERGDDRKRRPAPHPVVQDPAHVDDVLKSRYLQSLYERYLPPHVTSWSLRREKAAEVQEFLRRLRRRYSNHHQHALSILESALLVEVESFHGLGKGQGAEGQRLLRLVREAGANLAVAAPW